MQRIEYFTAWAGQRLIPAIYVRRLSHVGTTGACTRQSAICIFSLYGNHEGLDGLLILPEMSQDQVKPCPPW